MKKTILLLLTIIWLSPNLWAQINNGKKILIVCTSSDKDLKYGMDGWGCFMPEVTDFYSTIHKFGFSTTDIDIMSPKGGAVPLIADQPSDWELPLPAGDEAKIRLKLINSLKPEQINPSDYNVIYYAGGYSCLTDFPNDTKIASIAAKIYEDGGVVGLVCDGITGLIPIKLNNGQYLVNGKRITTNGGYTVATSGLAVEDILTNNGAVILVNDNVVVDSRIVTARNVRPIEAASEIMNLLGFGRFPTNVANNNSNKNMHAYPNPATDFIKIQLPDEYSNEIVQYSLKNIMSQIVAQGNFSQGGMIPLQGLSAGQYVLTAITKQKRFQTLVFVDN